MPERGLIDRVSATKRCLLRILGYMVPAAGLMLAVLSCVAFSFEIQEAREGLVSGETEQNPVVALYLFEPSGKSSVQ